jgi:hypothetical protein
VWSAPVSGGDRQKELATSDALDEFPTDIAVDASGVYVTLLEPNRSRTALIRVDSGTAKELAWVTGASYGNVRTSATAMYWIADWQHEPPSDGASVRKLCK